MELTLITVNTNGLCNVDKRSVLVQWLRSRPTVPDVVCLQECHCVSLEECQSWFRSAGFSSVVSLGSRRSCGCIVLFHNPLLLVNSWTDTDGRFLQCEFFCRNSIFRVACVYAPDRNPERDGFFADVSSRIDPAVPTFLCGDFNAAGLDISARPLAQASVKSVGRVQITDHSPVWRVRFFIAKKLIKLQNKRCFLYSVLPRNL